MLRVAVPQTPSDGVFCVFNIPPLYSAELPTNGVNSTPEVTTRFRSSDGRCSSPMSWLAQVLGRDMEAVDTLTDTCSCTKPFPAFSRQTGFQQLWDSGSSGGGLSYQIGMY